MESTKVWEQYQNGINYKSTIELFDTVDKNERFYSKRHWEGVKTNGLPAAVLPYSKRIADFKVSMIMSDMVTMNFTADGIGDNMTDDMSNIQREVAGHLTDYARTMAENTKFNHMNEAGLLDGVISGDMVSFWYWDPQIDAGNGNKGDVNGHLVDNVNYFPGDVNDPEVNSVYGPTQPYIIISFRKNVGEVRQQAKDNGVREQDIKLITSDKETWYQAGDLSQYELASQSEDDGKCIVLLKMWKEYKDGDWHIWANESTEYVTIRKDWDTGLHRYPVSLMNWDIRKGSCHGEPEMTSLIPNQIVINQMASMIALWIKLHGFPKVIYDKTRIPSWDNSLDKAIPVNGVDAGGVGGAAQYMQPAQLSAAVQQFFQTFIALTKEASGANESVLGEANPNNTSAIIVNSKAAAVPLNSIKRRFYRYIEDVGLIWLDFWMSKYTDYPDRQIEINKDGMKQVIRLDTDVLKNMRLKLRIDVGASTQWSEAAATQTLDNLLTRDKISFIEYLKRIPRGIIPDTQGLINSRETGGEKELLFELMARFVDSLPPEQKQAIMKLPPEQMEDAVKQLIQQTNNPAPAPQAQQGQQMPMQEPQPTDNGEQRPYANNVTGGGINEMRSM